VGSCRQRGGGGRRGRERKVGPGKLRKTAPVAEQQRGKSRYHSKKTNRCAEQARKPAEGAASKKKRKLRKSKTCQKNPRKGRGIKGDPWLTGTNSWALRRNEGGFDEDAGWRKGWQGVVALSETEDQVHWGCREPEQGKNVRPKGQDTRKRQENVTAVWRKGERPPEKKEKRGGQLSNTGQPGSHNGTRGSKG